jgi:hypothetical protein
MGLIGMKIIVPKYLHCAAWTGIALLLLSVTYRDGTFAAMRLVVGAVFVYGAISLAGTLVEKVWMVSYRFALRRGVLFPRLAAIAAVLFVLFLVALIFQTMSDVPGGCVAVVVVSGGFILVGGCLVGGRWLEALWEVCAGIFHWSPNAESKVQ